MAQNSHIFFYYGGRIVKSSDGCSYDPPEPSVLDESTTSNRNYAQLCYEICDNIGWSFNDTLKIQGKYPYLKGNEWHFRAVKITTDNQLVQFAERVKKVGLELEIYVSREIIQESHIGTSSRTNVIENADDNEILEPVNNEMGNEYCEREIPIFDSRILEEEDEDDENEIDVEPEMGPEDEEEIYGDGERERQKFVYTEFGQMNSVGNFGNPPAAEFEDISMWELARNDVIAEFEDINLKASMSLSLRHISGAV